jgi:hypothetical protein
MPRQAEADILADHIDHRGIQLLGIDMLRIDPTQCLRGGDLGGVAGSLIGAEVAAVAEHGEQIALDGLRELRIRARGWAEVTGEAGPVLAVFEDVEEVTFRHPDADLLLKFRQPLGAIGYCQLLQVRRPVRVNAQFGVGRKAGVDFRRRRDQLALQRGDSERVTAGMKAAGARGRHLGRQSRGASSARSRPSPPRPISASAKSRKRSPAEPAAGWSERSPNAFASRRHPV